MPKNGEQPSAGESRSGGTRGSRSGGRGRGRNAGHAAKPDGHSSPEADGHGAVEVDTGLVAGDGQAGAGRPMIDLEFVRGLIAAVDQSGIDSLEIMRAGTRIRIAKTPSPVAAPAGAPQPALPAGVTAVAGGAAPAAAEAAAPEAMPSPPAAPAVELVEVKSPMVGTFYRAPAPEAPPYVEVGGTVSKGQTLCILEAMKLMNELESEVDGVVREVLVENAEPVEYGQVLFRIEPTGDRA